MDESGRCSGGRHNAPKTGGSCPCGIVTMIPAPRRAVAGPPPEILALLAQCLADGGELLDPAASGLLRQRADRLLSALTTAGLLTSGGAERMAA